MRPQENEFSKAGVGNGSEGTIKGLFLNTDTNDEYVYTIQLLENSIVHFTVEDISQRNSRLHYQPMNVLVTEPVPERYDFLDNCSSRKKQQIRLTSH